MNFLKVCVHDAGVFLFFFCFAIDEIILCIRHDWVTFRSTLLVFMSYIIGRQYND